MKTSKQLSQQVMEKISQREHARRTLKARALKTTALAAVCVVLLPVFIYVSVSEKQTKDLPLSMPLEQDDNRPFDENDLTAPQMQSQLYDINTILIEQMRIIKL